MRTLRLCGEMTLAAAFIPCIAAVDYPMVSAR